jgi:hypothetical protein
MGASYAFSCADIRAKKGELILATNDHPTPCGHGRLRITRAEQYGKKVGWSSQGCAVAELYRLDVCEDTSVDMLTISVIVFRLHTYSGA